MTAEDKDKLLSGIPRSDVIAAFDYYIKNYNNGRPFILAGHSQGSNMLLYLLSEYMKEHPDVYKRMVAASDIDGSNPVVLEGSLVINPITWTRDETYAGADENLGSILPCADGSVVLDENGEFKRVLNFADACVDTEKGVLICSTVDVDTWAPGHSVFPKGVFHTFDYQFYYYNIRENAANRAKQFFNNQ